METSMSREQYDTLVQTRPDWIKEFWPRFSKQWKIGRVVVTGEPTDIQNLLLQFAPICATCGDVGRLDCCDKLDCPDCQGLFTKFCPDC